jgi:hypothetical protein
VSGALSMGSGCPVGYMNDTPALLRAKFAEALQRVRFVSSLDDDVLIDRAEAKRLLRCDDATIADLVAQGLRIDQRTEAFSYCDIMNVGLYSGTARSVPELAERFITRFSAEPPLTWTQRRRWRLAVEGRCTRAGGCAGGQWALAATPAQAYRRDPSDIGSRVDTFRTTFEAETSGYQMEVQAAPIRRLHSECLERFRSGAWQYQYLPLGLRDDPVAADRLGVMNCFSVAGWLSERLRMLGIETRVRHGLLLAFMGMEHAWVDARDADGVFKPLDPVIAVLAARSAVPASSFASFTCGSRFNRVLASRANTGQIVTHACDGRKQTVTLLVYARPADRRSG